MNYDAIKTTYVRKLFEVKQGNESLKQKLNECLRKDTQNTGKISQLENELRNRVISTRDSTRVLTTEETKVDTPPEPYNVKIYKEIYDKFQPYFIDDKLSKDDFVIKMRKNPRINNLNLKDIDEDKKSFQNFLSSGMSQVIRREEVKKFLDEFFEKLKDVMEPPKVKKLDDDSIFKKSINIKFASKPRNVSVRNAAVNTSNPQSIESANTQYSSVTKKFFNSREFGLLLKYIKKNGLVLNQIFVTDSDIKDDETLKIFLLANVEELTTLNNQLNSVSKTLYEELKIMESILERDPNANVSGGQEFDIVMKIFFQKLFEKDYTLDDFISKQIKKNNVEEALNNTYKYLKKAKTSFNKLSLGDEVETLLLYIRRYLIAQGKTEQVMTNANEVINLFTGIYSEDFIRQIYDKIDERYFITDMWKQAEFEDFNSQITSYNNTLKFMNSPIKKEQTKTEKFVENNNYFKLEKKDFGDWADKFLEIDNMIKDYQARFSQLARGLSLNDDETRKFKSTLNNLLTQLLPVYKKQKALIDSVITKVKKSLLILPLSIDKNIQEDFLPSNVIDGVKRKSLSKKSNNNTMGERKKLRSIKKKRSQSLQNRFRRMNKD